MNGVYGQGFDKVKIKMKKTHRTDSRIHMALPAEGENPKANVRRSNSEE